RLGEHEARVRRQLDVDGAVEARAVEQDRLLRQPRERSGRAGAKLDPDLRVGPERAVDLFGRCARNGKPRRIACRDVEVEAVAAGDAARGVDERRLKLAGARPGKMHTQPTRLVQPYAAGDPAAVFGDERDAADRTVRGKHLRAVFGEAHLTMPARA